MSFWKNFWYVKPQNIDETQIPAEKNQPTQPSQRSPFRPINPPRVDNKNQPWYGGARSWLFGPDASYPRDPVTETTDGFVHRDVGSSWLALNNFFGGATPKANLTDKNSVVGVNMGDDQR